jgi:hypothetical protein
MNEEYKLATKNPMSDKINDKFDSSKGQRPLTPERERPELGVSIS